MNTDIRLAVGFFDHPKTVKLERLLGPQAVISLMRLWLWAVQHRPGGVLFGMDADDIEIVARWSGEKGAFLPAITELRFLDSVDGAYRVHDWEEHNPWQSEAEGRADKARFSRLRQVCPEGYERLKSEGINAITKADYLRMASVKRVSGQTSENSGDSLADAEEAPGGVRQNAGESPTPAPVPFQPLSFPVPEPAPNEKRKTPCQVFGEDSEAFRLALCMRDTLKISIPTLKEPDLQKWARDFDIALRNDERMAEPHFVAQVIKWACSDSFWRANIQSPAKLREKFDQLTAKMETEAAKARAARPEWQSPAQRRVEQNKAACEEAKALLFGNKEAGHD